MDAKQLKEKVIGYLKETKQGLVEIEKALETLSNRDDLTHWEIVDFMSKHIHNDNLRYFLKDTKDVYDNVPYGAVKEYVESDLSEYGQSNPAPLSLTIVEDDGSFRHYELGPIVGYLIIGLKNKDCPNYYHFMVTEIHEDDEHWFAPSAPLYMDAAWLYTVSSTMKRAQKWFKEHIKQHYDYAKSENSYTEFLKPIEDETIFEKNGESACPVLGGPISEED